MSEENRAKDQTTAQLATIETLVKALKKAEKKENDEEVEEAREAIHENPLSVEIRSGWHAPGNEGEEGEYNILLCTGGPAVRLIGDLDENAQPFNARLEYQDWGTPWTNYQTTKKEEEVLVYYAQQFYFEE